MKKITFIAIFLVSFIGFSQEEKNEKIKNWTLGFGVNFIDNTSLLNNQFLNVSDHWNSIQSISKVSVERSITNLFSAEAALTINKLSKDKLQNGTTIVSDLNYMAIDVSGKFYFDEFIVEKSNIDSYIILGAGLNSANSIYNGTGNFGLGFNYWLQPNLGFRVQTIGKYAFEQKEICNNHLQHSVELIFKF